MTDHTDHVDWQAYVLAHLTNTDIDELEPDALADSDLWMRAYATLMAMRGRVEPPELLADLHQRVETLETHMDTSHKQFHRLFEMQHDNLQDVRRQVSDLAETSPN